MKRLSSSELYWIESASVGPFSYRAEDQGLLTHANGITFCASTYAAMVGYGWVREAA